MEKIATKMQQSINSRLSAITGAAKNPAMAKAEGIDVRDPDAIKRRIDELRAQKAALENSAPVRMSGSKSKPKSSASNLSETDSIKKSLVLRWNQTGSGVAKMHSRVSADTMKR